MAVKVLAPALLLVSAQLPVPLARVITQLAPLPSPTATSPMGVPAPGRLLTLTATV